MLTLESKKLTPYSQGIEIPEDLEDLLSFIKRPEVKWAALLAVPFLMLVRPLGICNLGGCLMGFWYGSKILKEQFK